MVGNILGRNFRAAILFQPFKNLIALDQIGSNFKGPFNYQTSFSRIELFWSGIQTVIAVQFPEVIFSQYSNISSLRVSRGQIFSHQI
jgi:hypothetical protein